MSQDKKSNKKLTVLTLSSMIITTVFAFNNAPNAFLLMGYSAIPAYIFGAVAFFVPFAFMLSEYGMAFKSEKGGMFSWMEKSVGTKFAFMGMFMWYTSFISYFVLVTNVFWIRISALIFGKDTTSSWELLGLNSTQVLGVLSIVFVVLMTFLATKGLDKISKMASVGGMAVAILNIVLVLGAIIILIANHGNFAQPVLIREFIHSPNSSYSSIVAVFSFISLAILAYGGMEASAGLVDKTENPEKTFPKAILICALIITIGYSLAIFSIGMFTNWGATLSSKGVNLGNVPFVVMNNLGYNLGLVFGMEEAKALVIGLWMTRFFALSSCLVVLGAYISLLYSPLRQLIEGTPARLWPGKIGQIDEGMPKKAMWVQCYMIIALIIFVSFGGAAASKFFNMLLLMTAVAMTIPYMFLAAAFPFFKKKTEIEKPFVIYKSYTSSLIWGIVVFITIGLANIFTIIQPLLSGDTVSSIIMMAGPIIFIIIGLLMYRRYENITKINSDEKLAK